ncbi:hypothetical protein CLHUN_10530 [Ruminiclostridium hungatei]|uniref:Uncharacterized protein n=1 Tax=Ruminiclostridium hungatei TaxID=48256 RepID=A0A1V4SNX0_RUMHU|nr:hypothetical protein [Ruminiclostridium hungatei]OPX45166.1 hypothetical protein CLHUN_10530 [Ruminiclostridium hungatei]
MPVVRGEKGRDMGTTNSRLNREIENDILGEMVNINDYMVRQNSILLSDTFHLDAMPSGDSVYKVDIQYRTGLGKTVAVVLLNTDAENIEDLKEGLRKSLKDGYIYIVR